MKARIVSRIYGPDDTVVACVGEVVEIIDWGGGFKPLPQSTRLGVGPLYVQRYKEFVVRLPDKSLATVDAKDLDASW